MIYEHALYTMDGRTWIEPYNPDPSKEKITEIKKERGWMILIPQDKLEAFIRSL